MSHKVNPVIHRIPIVHNWDSKWFARGKDLPKFLEQEVKVREYLAKKLKDAGIDAINIERSPKEMKIVILAAKPGAVIGRSGTGLEDIRKGIEKNIVQFKLKVKLDIQAVRNPALSAKIVAGNAALEIEKRMPFRRIMKQAIEKIMAAGAKGVKIRMAGRLNGAEIARTEKLSAGKMSLITFRSDVDYAFAEAHTIYGKIGIKVWIYHGEVFGMKDKFDNRAEGVKKELAHSSDRAKVMPSHNRAEGVKKELAHSSDRAKVMPQYNKPVVAKETVKAVAPKKVATK